MPGYWSKKPASPPNKMQTKNFTDCEFKPWPLWGIHEGERCRELNLNIDIESGVCIGTRGLRKEWEGDGA